MSQPNFNPNNPGYPNLPVTNPSITGSGDAFNPSSTPQPSDEAVIHVASQQFSEMQVSQTQPTQPSTTPMHLRRMERDANEVVDYLKEWIDDSQITEDIKAKRLKVRDDVTEWMENHKGRRGLIV